MDKQPQETKLTKGDEPTAFIATVWRDHETQEVFASISGIPTDDTKRSAIDSVARVASAVLEAVADQTQMTYEQAFGYLHIELDAYMRVYYMRSKDRR